MVIEQPNAFLFKNFVSSASRDINTGGLEKYSKSSGYLLKACKLFSVGFLLLVDDAFHACT